MKNWICSPPQLDSLDLPQLLAFKRLTIVWSKYGRVTFCYIQTYTHTSITMIRMMRNTWSGPLVCSVFQQCAPLCLLAMWLTAAITIDWDLYICIFLYLYICIFLYLYLCIFVYLYICIFLYLFICIFVCLYVCIFLYLYICKYKSKIQIWMLEHKRTNYHLCLNWLSTKLPSLALPLAISAHRRDCGVSFSLNLSIQSRFLKIFPLLLSFPG